MWCNVCLCRKILFVHIRQQILSEFLNLDAAHIKNHYLKKFIEFALFPLSNLNPLSGRYTYIMHWSISKLIEQYEFASGVWLHAHQKVSKHVDFLFSNKILRMENGQFYYNQGCAMLIKFYNKYYSNRNYIKPLRTCILILFLRL